MSKFQVVAVKDVSFFILMNLKEEALREFFSSGLYMRCSWAPCLLGGLEKVVRKRKCIIVYDKGYNDGEKMHKHNFKIIKVKN